MRMKKEKKIFMLCLFIISAVVIGILGNSV